ncbi:MAG: TonB-dependent receptor [Muribaculaceae bacterium]|nr:TonB-dependent receptor [Muribaculaceae bacterium]
MKKFICILFVLMMGITAALAKQNDKATTYVGTIQEQNGTAMPFVNVVLLNNDSTFVTGTTTDEAGKFNLGSTVKNGILKISSIGYQTIYINIKNGYMASDPIRMSEDSHMLGEVVVKSTLPRTHVKGDAMRTTVAGTILEKAGTASDALKKIPALKAEKDGAVEVFGRGAAEVYINGRKVQDLSELSRLQSDQIQSVDVVQNPGARYAASTKAVVRITLKKKKGDGFSIANFFDSYRQYEWTVLDDIDINYRTGGLDVTLNVWAGQYNSQSPQDNVLSYYNGTDFIEGKSYSEQKKIWRGFSPQIQLNYQFNENHSIGAFYKWDRHPASDNTATFTCDSYENGARSEHSESDINQRESFKKHIFNAYYNGKVGNLGIDFNVDGLFDNTNDPNSTRETIVDKDGNKTVTNINNLTVSKNNFWATKLVLTHPLWGGNLTMGAEYSHNNRADSYSFVSEQSLPVQNTDSRIKENMASGFVEYGHQFGKLYAQAGIRYEHLSNNYYNFGVRQDEVCRNYGDWFPTVVLAMPVGKTQMSLSYRRDIDRPAYSSLTSSTIYINKYTYQSGNPYLRPTYTHSLVYNLAWNAFNLNMNFQRTKDNVTMITEPFPGSSDPLVSLIHPANGDEFNRMMISPSYRPVFSAWHPMWSVGLILQNYKSLNMKGEKMTLNHPFLQVAWKNDFELPHNFRLNAAIQFVPKGCDYTNFRLDRAQIDTQLGVQKDFNLRAAGRLTLDVRCYDPFHLHKTGATIFGVRELALTTPAHRTFQVSVTWKLNETSKKYRGSGAGEKQKARMGK